MPLAIARSLPLPVRSISVIAANRCSIIRFGHKNQEDLMNEDVFNASLRKFLKKVGITSQREIEKAVRDAVTTGRLKGHEKLPAKMVLTLGGVSRSYEVSDESELGSEEARLGTVLLSLCPCWPVAFFHFDLLNWQGGYFLA